jgi:hypothetical protein
LISVFTICGVLWEPIWLNTQSIHLLNQSCLISSTLPKAYIYRSYTCPRQTDSGQPSYLSKPPYQLEHNRRFDKRRCHSATSWNVPEADDAYSSDNSLS